MTDRWEQQFKAFLNRTTHELRRAGEEIKTEAQKLIDEVKDPEKQRRVKAGLRDFGQWAKRTAEEVGELVEKGVKKAEGAISRPASRSGASPVEVPPPTRQVPTPTRAKSTRKTVGGKRKAVTGRPAPAAKKTIGKKKPTVS